MRSVASNAVSDPNVPVDIPNCFRSLLSRKTELTTITTSSCITAPITPKRNMRGGAIAMTTKNFTMPNVDTYF